MGRTKIEWTATYHKDGTVSPGYTFNPWIGCTKVSPGCTYCYAENSPPVKFGSIQWGPDGERQRTSEAYWKKPLAWNRKAAREGVRYKVFCASLADVFEDNPQLVQWRADLFELIYNTPNLDWLLLTKRIENVRGMMPPAWTNGFLPNIWLGTTVENQEMADKRIPELLRIFAKVRFLSLEPLLGPIDLTRWLRCYVCGGQGDDCPMCNSGYDPQIDWVIVGGESGSKGRCMNPNWVRSLLGQCREAGIPFFFKQWGEWGPAYCAIGDRMVKLGKKNTGASLDGREWKEFPK